jgi:peptidoglycan/LPS O-acetylase OafA/YrhL
MKTSPTPAGRLPFLDGLRVAALLLLIPYHVGMYYVSWDWHVKSPHASPGLEPLMLLTAPWRLGLLFLVAGAACQGLLARLGPWAFVRERSRRLLLPLVFGMAVIVVPQAYYELQTQAAQLLPGSGGYLEFWAAYLQGARYCQGDDCLQLPTWNHLWFLPYLWLYGLLTALLLAWRPTTSLRPQAWTLAPVIWLWAPALPLVAFRLGLMPWFPSTHDLVDDLYNHAQYGYLFALGWASRSVLAALWPQALRWRWISLALALVGWALLASYFVAYADQSPPVVLLWAQRVLWGMLTWWSILAACGWAQRAFERESPWLRAASAGVFCVYILHQTVIVVLSQWLAPLRLAALPEGLLLIALTLLISGAIYVLARPVPGLRTCLGIAGGKGRAARTIGAGGPSCPQTPPTMDSSR